MNGDNIGRIRSLPSFSVEHRAQNSTALEKQILINRYVDSTVQLHWAFDCPNKNASSYTTTTCTTTTVHEYRYYTAQ